jgi:hypothetical protein
MALHHERRFQDLLARFEGRYSDTLRRQREQAKASAAFLERFHQLDRTLLQPCLDELAERLNAYGIAAQVSYRCCYDREACHGAESILLAISLRDDPDTRAGGCEPGITLSVDGKARQVRLGVRGLAHPGDEHIRELPLLEQWTTQLIEEELLEALEQVLLG